ncbi:MAG: sigma-70 family RNA polymerase sigma factor [Candidatus Doudnabacteria bacterium]|nr:sigma-70 family RNA polymerase sigma factor [Candidatus Doudnabacteria bacterium]
MLQEQEIQELIVQAKRGNTDAFGQIYDSLSQPLFNFLFARLRQKEQAEDLLQTVFLKIWHNLETYKPSSRAKFSTWAFQIANYTLIDYWRTRKETSDISLVENLSDFALNPTLYEKYDYLWEALRQLPDDYQTVIDLRFRQDRTVIETAKIMGKSQVGVRVLQHRAIKALREQLTSMNKI